MILATISPLYIPLFYGFHDPSTGFNDIKPLPSFNPLNIPLIASVLAAVLCVIYLIYRWNKKTSSPLSTPPIKPPNVIALSNIKQLRELKRRNEIDVREMGTQLSLIIRLYLETVFCFHACEETTNEVCSRLPIKLLETLPVVTKEKSEEILTQVKELLHFAEYLCFADDSPAKYFLEGTDIDQSLDSSEALIHAIAHQLHREQERTTSITQKPQGNENAI